MPVAENDNYGTKLNSRLIFLAAPGISYSIAVCGKSADITKRGLAIGDVGDFRLSWYSAGPPGFTSTPFAPSAAAPGSRVVLTGTNFTGATDVLFNGVSAIFSNGLTSSRDVRIVATVPPNAASGSISVLTPHGAATSPGSFTVLPPGVVAPSIVRVTALTPEKQGPMSNVAVFFDEEVEQTSAESLTNYTINSGAITVSSAVLRLDLKSVLLSTAPLTLQTDYTITVRSVADRSPNRNTISALSQSFRADNLVLHLTCDEPAAPGANVTGHCPDGTVIDEPVLVPGVSGSALRFDGVDDYLEVPYNPNLGITTDLTLAAWVKRESFGKYHVIVAKTSGRNRWDYDLYFEGASDTLKFWSDGLSPRESVSSGRVTNRNWNHVAVTRRGGAVTFYINGVAAGTATVTGNFPDSQFPVRVGSDAPTTMFQGALDDLRIYSRALSAAEVQRLSLPPLRLSLTARKLTLSWPLLGARFTPEVSEDLNSGAWSVITDQPSAQDAVTTITLDAPSGNRFYRLRR